MLERPVSRDHRPWNKGLLIGQKKPLEPPAVAAQHVNVSEATIPQFPKDKPEVMLERS
jgi:hypothetical protein